MDVNPNAHLPDAVRQNLENDLVDAFEFAQGAVRFDVPLIQHVSNSLVTERRNVDTYLTDTGASGRASDCGNMGHTGNCTAPGRAFRARSACALARAR